LEFLDLSILCLAALLTAVLSAVIGMAGGITLLAVMLFFYDPLIAIPIHGVVQLVSNGSRSIIQRRHIRWGIIWRYGALLFPMGLLGLSLAEALPPAGARCLIGAFVLVATWAPKLLLMGTHPEQADSHRRFWVLGAVVGFINVTVGATGPLIAPFFLSLGLTRQALVGTKAACQMLGHLAKLAVFGIAGFAFAEFALPLALLSLSVVIGTWVGSRLLEHVSEVWFVRLYRTVLTVIAVRLFVWDGLALLGLRG
jgi:uncharacterized membrane protein YfcA